MPSSTQIVPKYLVPHVATYINDNSTFTDTVATAPDDATRLLCVFTSSKGEDGVIKSFTNLREYIDEYGDPNYKLYGQPCYMPYAALSTGNAKCYCMRVMPETATYSNIVIVAKTKTVTNIETGKDDLKIKFVAEYLNDLVNKDDVLLKMKSIAKYPPQLTDDGENIFPLFTVNMKGRGKYGNAYSIRLTSDQTMNMDNDFMNYLLEVIEINSGRIKNKETHQGSFDYSAIINNTSLLFDDVISDPDKGSKKIDIVTCEDGLTKLYDLIVSTATAAGETNIPQFSVCDLFTGLTKTGDAIPNVTIDRESDDYIALDKTIGVALKQGDDSTFDENYEPQTIDGILGKTRDECIEEMYIKAFNGDLDPSIRSKRAVPCELILDAGYPENVKLKMVECALKRYDAYCIIDAGYLSTVSSALIWSQKPAIKAIADPIISKEFQHYTILDPFSNKRIPVTITYFYALSLPNHYKDNGNQTPFHGVDYAQLTGHIRNSLKPVIDADDLDIKEKFYTAQCNMFERIAENTFTRATQGTSQNYWSDLSEENNVLVMLEMKRMLETLVSGRLYKFAEESDRNDFSKTAELLFATYRNRKVKDFSVFFDMNKFEQERSILHCYLSVQFKTMAKRGIIEIDINSRV